MVEVTYIAEDCGTASFRLWAVDAGGSVQASVNDVYKRRLIAQAVENQAAPESALLRMVQGA
jgi:2-keto-3-deoxy-galactonokinase